ncbi:MAG: hypothetical protein CM1200mP17_06090 [Woeseia sp.]|nr:MAG: hypothetical protein CM1200mP17_06090 [Woeseia sp.]
MSFNLELIKFRELQTTMEDGKRFYKTPDGDSYPSVTSVTGILAKKWDLGLAPKNWRREGRSNH